MLGCLQVPGVWEYAHVPERARLSASKPSAHTVGAKQPHRAAIPTRRQRFRRDFLLTAMLGGIVAGLVVAFVYGIYMPKSPWAFDRPEAQLPSLQPRHTLQ
jgi:hypothetical protein